MDFKNELANKAASTTVQTQDRKNSVKLTANMDIADMIKAMEPEIKKALQNPCGYIHFREDSQQWYPMH